MKEVEYRLQFRHSIAAFSRVCLAPALRNSEKMHMAYRSIFNSTVSQSLCLTFALAAFFFTPWLFADDQATAFQDQSETLPAAAEDDGQSSVPAERKPLSAIDVSGFGSGISHWRDLRDDRRFITVEPDQASWRPDQVREIVSNILLFQRENGGWPKDYDMTAVLSNRQRQLVEATRTDSDTSYDNGNIYSQVEYLAKAYVQSGDSIWREACERGFDFMLRSQYSNGGFPQRYPKHSSYHAHITFNDGVMIGILDMLQDITEQKPHFAWLDAERRERAAEAVRLAIDCILRCQIVVDGTATGWCQQHDKSTFEARSARTFELASICPQETAEIVRFLMRQPEPDARMLAATDAAVAWLKEVRMQGIRVDRIKAPSEEFLRQTVSFDIVVVSDENAPPIWARHYEIGTNRPVFAGRDGIKKYSLAEIERERRSGTLWYGYWPDYELLGSYDTWRRSHNLSE